jgi:hypothetical protein
LLNAWRNEDDGCQLAEEAVMGVHFPPVRARDSLGRCGVSAKTLEEELAKYISKDELKYILTTKNGAAQLMSLQSKTVKELCDARVFTCRYRKYAILNFRNLNLEGTMQVQQ